MYTCGQRAVGFGYKAHMHGYEIQIALSLHTILNEKSWTFVTLNTPTKERHFRSCERNRDEHTATHTFLMWCSKYLSIWIGSTLISCPFIPLKIIISMGRCLFVLCLLFTRFCERIWFIFYIIMISSTWNEIEKYALPLALIIIFPLFSHSLSISVTCPLFRFLSFFRPL